MGSGIPYGMKGWASLSSCFVWYVVLPAPLPTGSLMAPVTLALMAADNCKELSISKVFAGSLALCFGVYLCPFWHLSYCPSYPILGALMLRLKEAQ